MTSQDSNFENAYAVRSTLQILKKASLQNYINIVTLYIETPGLAVRSIVSLHNVWLPGSYG